MLDSLRARVTGVYELFNMGAENLNSSSLKEQEVLLTTNVSNVWKPFLSFFWCQG